MLRTNEKGHGRCDKEMEGVLGGATSSSAIRKWKGSWAMLQAHEKGNGGCHKHKQMEANGNGLGRCRKQMKRVMGGDISKWKGSCAALQANEKGHGRCYKQMEGVLGNATSSSRPGTRSAICSHHAVVTKP